MDLDRTWGAFDGDRVVTTLRSFESHLTVPGGTALAASAVTAVTTTSTHRRRGLAVNTWPPSWSQPSRRQPKPGFHVVARDPAGAAIGLAGYEFNDKSEHRQPRAR